MDQIKITQVRSVISTPKSLRKIVRALGLRGINQTRVHKDNNCTRGMINKVKHLVSYELISSK